MIDVDYKDWYNANVVFVQIHIYNRSYMSYKRTNLSATYNGESEILLIGGATNMYAIIQTGGKQFSVEEGQVIYVEKLAGEAGDTVTFDEVLLIGGDETKFGTPLVDGASVEATIEKQGRAKKVTTYRYLRRKDSHRKQGHRQPYTKLTISKINA